MKFHREGKGIILISVLLFLLLNGMFYLLLQPPLFGFLLVATLLLLVFIIQFFRNPARPVAVQDASKVYAPADGTVVVIEETEEKEYLKEKRLLISIFMSPLNVHVNRIPVSGTISYRRHHPGGYLPAWNPKSSEKNERFTSVITSANGTVLIRQIAGAMARRISNYPEVGQQATQGDELGFIKFGSRVDIFLPLDTEVEVEIGSKVRGNIDILGILPPK